MEASKSARPTKYSTIYRVLDVAHHRNGMTGHPFHVVLFEVANVDHRSLRRMVAVVSQAKADANSPTIVHVPSKDRVVAVMDVDLLAEGIIGAHEDEKLDNRFRGDHYQHDLESAIREHQIEEAKRFRAENAAARKATKAPSAGTRRRR
jgi:hypothetical protein